MSRRYGQRAPGVPVIDIVVASPLWSKPRGVKAVLRRAIAATASAVSTRPGEVAIVLTDDSAMRALNREWRGKDEPTNVLSFPAKTPAKTPRARRAMPRLMGDIVIAYQTCAREAKAEHKPFRHHLAHLAVHGYLHLAGYDHAADADAEAMEMLEIAVLRRLKVPSPYVARDREG